jgi:uncharacterized protein (TIGR02594 family)
MANAIPAQLVTMRAITGTIESPGDGDNPTILGWAQEIGRRFPELASYCANYTHDAIAWCGLTVGYCMAMAGIRPVFGASDTERFLYAMAWKNFGSPVDVADAQPGDVLVFNHHVTLCDGIDGDYVLGRGGNQSDQVKVSRYAKSALLAVRRPPAPGLAPTAGDAVAILGAPPDQYHRHHVRRRDRRLSRRQARVERSPRRGAAGQLRSSASARARLERRPLGRLRHRRQGPLEHQRRLLANRRPAAGRKRYRPPRPHHQPRRHRSHPRRRPRHRPSTAKAWSTGNSSTRSTL